MAYNFGSRWQLPTGVFNPIPDPATLPINLVTVGVYFATSCKVAAMMPWPQVVISLFGLGMICLGWLVADNPARYTALGKTVMRASHVVLVFTIALREVASASMASANTTKK